MIFCRITESERSVTQTFSGIGNILPYLPYSDVKPVDCAIDSTRFKITIRGDYLGLKMEQEEERSEANSTRSSQYTISQYSPSPSPMSMSMNAKGRRKSLENVKDRVKRIFEDKDQDSKVIFNVFPRTQQFPQGGMPPPNPEDYWPGIRLSDLSAGHWRKNARSLYNMEEDGMLRHISQT